MKAEKELKKLKENKEKLKKYLESLDEMLDKDTITPVEHELSVKKTLQGMSREQLFGEIDRLIEIEQEKVKIQKNKHKKINKTLANSILLLFIGTVIFAVLTNMDFHPIGYSIASTDEYNEMVIDETFSSNQEININITNATCLKITGHLIGESATVKLRKEQKEYVVALIEKQSSNIITGFTIMENFTIENETIEEIDYTNETLNQTNNISENITIYNTENNTVNISANQTINQTINETNITNQTNISTNETVNVSVNVTENTTIEETLEEKHYFESVCAETCHLPSLSNFKLVIELTNSSLYIEKISYMKNQKNNKPIEIKEIVDQEISINSTITINLSNHYEDPDDDKLYYEINEMQGVQTEITDDILSLTGLEKGLYLSYIYVTDEEDLLIGETFNIIVEDDISQGDFNIFFGNQKIAEVNQNGKFFLKGELIQGEYIEEIPEKSFIIKNNMDIEIAYIDSEGNLVLAGFLEKELTIKEENSSFIIKNSNSENILLIDNYGNLYLKNDIVENNEFQTA
jgi:hypothetical protein